MNADRCLFREIVLNLRVEEIISKEWWSLYQRLDDVLRASKTGRPRKTGGSVYYFRKRVEPILTEIFLERRGMGVNMEAAIKLCHESGIRKKSSWIKIIDALLWELAYNRKIPISLRRMIKKTFDLK